jgi:formate hydrogenlyase subunit 4
MGYVAIPTAVGGFFFSSFLTMLFCGIVAPWFGIETISYLNAMVVTIALWLVIAPVAAAISRRTRE